MSKEYVKKYQCEICARVHSSRIDGAPPCVLSSECLCGAALASEDYKPSMLLGAHVRCERCREKMIAGVPSGEAARQSFIERGLAIR